MGAIDASFVNTPKAAENFIRIFCSACTWGPVLGPAKSAALGANEKHVPETLYISDGSHKIGGGKFGRFLGFVDINMYYCRGNLPFTLPARLWLCIRF